MGPTRWNFGEIFSNVLEVNLRSLLSSGWKRDHNAGAPFDFGENHLRKFIRSAVASGSYSVPAEWPSLHIERHVDGDLREAGKRHGGIDYFLTTSTSPGRIHLRNLLATCEVGGPTRPKLLSGSSKKNWYPKIVDDIRKQRWRAQAAPDGKHYLALLIRPRVGFEVRDDFHRLVEVMLQEVGGADLHESSWREMSDLRGLNLAVFQVLPR